MGAAPTVPAACRIVSLVPSLTEAVFDLGAGNRLVGVSDFCLPPPGHEELVRVGGPKTPHRPALAALEPDLVILGREECCLSDLGWYTSLCDVYIADCRSVDDALTMLTELGQRLGRPGAASLQVERIRAAAASLSPPDPLRPVFYPIWTDPWMTVSRGSFASDMLRRAGGRSIFADRPEAYPVVSLEEARRRDPAVVLLPDEPHAFTEADRERFAAFAAYGRDDVRCVPGRWAAWYGTRMDLGLKGLRDALAVRRR